MNDNINKQEGAESVTYGPGSWVEALVATLPIIWVGVLYLLSNLFSGSLGWYWGSRIGFLALTLIPAIGFGVAWVRGFPRWSYSYLGSLVAILIFSRLIMNDPRYDLPILLYFWSPFLLALAIGLIISRSFHPATQLVKGIWQDWTRLSFALYGMLPMMMLDAFDGIHLSYRFLLEIITILILVAGAVAYIRSSKSKQRAISLLSGFGVTWIMITGVNAIYWNGRLEVWMREPANWQTTTFQLVIPGLLLIVLIFSPILLGGLRWLTYSHKSA